MNFDSLAHFADHLGHLVLKFAEHEAGAMGRGALPGGGGRSGGGEASAGEILHEGAAIIEAEIKSGFSGSNPFGLAPLAPATIAKKGNNRFLVETGELAGSIEKSIGEHDARVGTNLERAVYLEMGTSRMPPRPTLATAGARAEPKIHALVQAKVAAALK
jgi:phage gpG-like protein